MSGYIGVDPIPNVTTIVNQGTFVYASNQIMIPAGYTVSNLEVYINGLRIKDTDYTAGDGQYIIFNTTLPVGTEYLIQEVRNYSESQSAGRLDKVEINTRAFVSKLASESGFNLVSGSFEEGAVTTSTVDVIWSKTYGKIYQKTAGASAIVTPGTDPSSDSSWVDKTAITLRSQVAMSSGNSSNTFSVATAVNNSHAVPLSQVNSIADTKINSRTGSGAYSFRNHIVDGQGEYWYEFNGTSTSYVGTSGYGAETFVYNTNISDTLVVTQVGITSGELDNTLLKNWSCNTVTSVSSASSYSVKKLRIEDARTLAGKTVTFSFYAKADATRPVAIEFIQHFGTGGSTTVTSIGVTTVNLTTTGTRYSVTATLPSVSTATIASDSRLEVNIWMDAGSASATRSNNLGQQSGVFYFAGYQLEEGSVATPFEYLPLGLNYIRTARYFWRYLRSGGDLACAYIGTGNATTQCIEHPTIMRTNPTVTVNSYSGYVSKYISGYSNFNITGITFWSENRWFYLNTTTATSSTPSGGFLSGFVCNIFLDARL